LIAVFTRDLPGLGAISIELGRFTFMFRRFLIVAGLMMLGATVVVAQSCPDTISARQGLMKKSGAAGKAAVAMIKGQTPFDLAKAKEIFATFANDAGKMPTLFPDCSKAGDDSTAAPAIWDNRSGFDATISKFNADIKAAQQNTKDLATFKASFAAIGHDCASCHQQFRVKKS
jgi:cytochrome c556